MKGESSGHTQEVVEIRYDCDADCLLVLVNQNGPGACHTNERFVLLPRACTRGARRLRREPPVSSQLRLGDVLDELLESSRRAAEADPEKSYTARLLSGNEDSLLKKIAEESGEVIMAAKDGDADHLRYEVGDLVYHLLVVMARWPTPDDLAEARFSADLTRAERRGCRPRSRPFGRRPSQGDGFAA